MIIKDKHVLALHKEPGINKFIDVIVWIGFSLSILMLFRALLGL